jgi:3'-phosphoadenosine 5'-phosphosulfate sulfotransferase (PAPS reductase)/FAD synthetase
MSALSDFIDRHARIVLLFSAGKDSAACLKLLRPHLDHVLVAWANPGNPYPETVDYMVGVQHTVPHFTVTPGHQPLFIKLHGYPADVMPFAATPTGRGATRSDGPRLVPMEQCCRANLWEPMHKVVVDYGATGCIRGDKACDQLRSNVSSGQWHGGFEFHFPLWDWTEQQVLDYLGDDLPPSYRRGLKTSLDCMNCTAYQAENPGRMADLREHYPQAYAEVAPIVFWMRDTAKRHLAALEAA